MLLRIYIGITSIFCISTTLIAMELNSPINYAASIAQYKVLGHYLPHAPLLRHVSNMRLYKALEQSKDMSHKLVAVALKALATCEPRVNTNQAKLTLLLANRSRVPLSTTHADLLSKHSQVLQNMHEDIGEVNQDELALPAIASKEQVDLLMAYISNDQIASKHEDYKKELNKYLRKCNLADIYALATTIELLNIQGLDNTDVIVQSIAEVLAHQITQGAVSVEDQSQVCALPADIQRKVVRKVLELTGLYAALHADHNSKRAIPYTELKGHRDLVYSVSWSPDSKYIASGNRDGIVRVWDATTGTCIHTLTGHTHPIYSLSWSSNGKQIASGSWDNTIRIWDATTGTCIHTLEGHTNWVTSVTRSPNDKHIASSSADNTIRVWNVTTGNCIHTLEGHTDTIWSIAWSPDGKYIASGSSDKTVRIWDTTTSTCIHTLKKHTHSINSAFWSPDGSMIASGSVDGTVIVWHAIKGICMHILEDDADFACPISWSPDGKCIASCTVNNTVKIWQWIDPAFDKELINEINLENILAIAKSKKLLSYLQ